MLPMPVTQDPSLNTVSIIIYHPSIAWFGPSLPLFTASLPFLFTLFSFCMLQLDKGLPGDPRFPERDNEWLESVKGQKEKLINWLEDFRFKFYGYQEAAGVIKQCEDALDKYESVINPILIPHSIKQARNARRAK